MKTLNYGVRPPRDQGFTLLELLSIIAIATLVLMLAAPSFSETLRNNRLTTQANDFVTALTIARSEAIKRGVRVTVCKSDDQATCKTTVNWEQGWIVFSDPDGVGVFNSATEDLIQVSSGLTGSNTLRTGADFQNYLSFMPSGASRGGPGPNNTGTFRLCDAQNTVVMHAVKINATGRASTEKGTASCP